MDHPKTTGRLRPRSSRADTEVPAAEMPGKRALSAMAEAVRRAQEAQPLLPPGRRRGCQRAAGQEEWGPGLALRRTQSPRVGGSRHSLTGFGGRSKRRHRGGAIPRRPTRAPLVRLGAGHGRVGRGGRPLSWPSFWTPLRMSSPLFTPPAPTCLLVTRPHPRGGRPVPHMLSGGQRDREPPCRARPLREPHRFSRRSVRQRGDLASR
jgi:hypothetical protein